MPPLIPYYKLQIIPEPIERHEVRSNDLSLERNKNSSNAATFSESVVHLPSMEHETIVEAMELESIAVAMPNLNVPPDENSLPTLAAIGDEHYTSADDRIPADVAGNSTGIPFIQTSLSELLMSPINRLTINAARPRVNVNCVQLFLSWLPKITFLFFNYFLISLHLILTTVYWSKMI